MKIIRIGLTNDGQTSLLHESCSVSSSELTVSGFLATKEQINKSTLGRPVFTYSFSQQCVFKIRNKTLNISGIIPDFANTFSLSCEEKDNSTKLFAVAMVESGNGSLSIVDGENSKLAKTYTGQLMIIADQNKIREILFHTLEDYVQSVLHGEVPATYHLEAIKAQAICARTYALNPRVNHAQDFCNVCDSYLCCQCFAEKPAEANSVYTIATNETSQQILTYQNRPALALFSACAGGHTENYEDCFSDIESKAFPAKPKPYLRGVSEALNEGSDEQIIDEVRLKELWHNHRPATVDAWSKNFRWQLKLSKEDLESHLHHNISQLIKQEDFTPFIVPPPSAVFGEILSITVLKRGVGGTVITLEIKTNKGLWKVVKELTIRNLFKNQSLKLKRLASAKIFFDQITDSKGSLLHLHIYGLGSGHGVGLQQVGAEGLARLGKDYNYILKHYYKNVHIDTI